MTLKIVGLVSLLTCSTFLVKAQMHQPKGFEIKGHISGIENGAKVYLYDIDGQAALDSTFATGGNFILRGRVARPTTCWVRCGSESTVVQVENTAMTFEAPIDKMQLNAVVKGGREQDLQNELTAKQYPFEKVALATYDSLVNNRFTSDTGKARLIKTFTEAQNTSQNIYVDFGKRHPDSYLGLDIIYRNRQAIGKDTVKTLFTAMGKEIGASPKAQALNIFISSVLAEKGKPFIDFDAQTLSGAAFTLSSLKGNYILLDFWSAGCGPCRMQNKKMSQEYAQLKDKISIVSFSLDVHKTDWAKASAADNVLWTNVSDLAGEDSHIKMRYDVQAIPTSFLINKEGVIVEKFIGYDDDFINQLQQLIAGK